MLGKLLRGSMRSSTIIGNGSILAFLIAFSQTELFTQLISINPQIGIYAAGVVAFLNFLNRFRTTTSVLDKAK